jgi:lipoic acid synthetase
MLGIWSPDCETPSLRRNPTDLDGYTPAVGRELPMFQPAAAAGDGHQHQPITIAMGGGRLDTARDGSEAQRRHPEWIRARLPSGPNYQELKSLMRGLTLNTVCEEAHCPNIGECWEQRTATVMILGDTCTRACGFCAVKTGRPTWNDEDEPRRVAQAVRQMGLEHVVVTSVARDDLADGGAHLFAETIRALRRESPGMGVEVLIPDFNGEPGPLRTVMEARPDILNHNVETVERLQKPVRKRARYDRSLGVLSTAKAMARQISGEGSVHTKSSLMVGLGETREELSATFRDLRAVDCDILTVGQYLRPSADHLPIVRYVPPAEFAGMKEEALALGFRHVESGPMVRSSYHARDQVPDEAKRARSSRAAALAANGIAGAA